MGGIEIHDLAMLFIFVVGYSLITIEHLIKVDKSTIALLTGISCWIIQYHHFPESCGVDHVCLSDRLSGLTQIVFFLLGALAIVEIISVHRGFSLISDRLKMRSKKLMLVTLCLITFFLSAILDNLTTTIVMVTLLAKLVEAREDRLLMGAAIVIAANAGGAWTPIGDVTTTMLWIGGQITSLPTMRDLFFPSLVCCFVATLAISMKLQGQLSLKSENYIAEPIEPNGILILCIGIGALIFVPIFKILTGLPPFMGVFLGLSVLWVVTDFIHSSHEDRAHLRMHTVFSKIDIPGLLFFVGILLAIDALEASGLLHQLAAWFDAQLDNTALIAVLIGLASSIVDNVPLVAASMGMYPIEQYPIDDTFWQLIAYCAGTGGSILIIGSAAGIVFMGLEKVSFGWYLKRISIPALLGYLAGIAVYISLFPK